MIPKTVEANLKWREAYRNAARGNPNVQGALRAACRQSILFWLNCFGWTYRQKKAGPDGKEIPCVGHEAHVPFITWLVQDEIILELEKCIAVGRDALIDKSRDMGASWICAAVLQHKFQFGENNSFLEVSRKEDLVDDLGNMDCLFEKHRYLMKWQPKWLLPSKIEDKYMHLGNVKAGNVIVGESTNGDVGRGGRKTAIFLDEFPAVTNGAEVDASTADTTACRIFNGTSKGPGTQHYKIIKEGRAKVLILPWWRHPEKGLGARQIREDGKLRWTSPWYEHEQKRRDKKAMAREVDMNHDEAGGNFFQHADIDAHIAAHARKPVLEGILKANGDPGDDRKKQIVTGRLVKELRFQTTGFDRPTWRFWIPLVDGRPPQDLSYIFGVDISQGAGASNSVMTCFSPEINQVVAKFWSAEFDPGQLAEQAAFAAVWFGGRNKKPYFVWENNGPGGGFGRKLVKHFGWRFFYYQRRDNSVSEEKGARWGWHSNNARKEVLLGRYRDALRNDEVINPCIESLEECKDYIYDESGLLIPAKLREESGGGRQLHGDHVIADALTVLGKDELPKAKEETMAVPAMSFAGRRATAIKASKQAQDDWSR